LIPHLRRNAVLAALITGIFSCVPLASVAASNSEMAGLDRLLKAGRNVQERVRLSPVREAALRASARTLGAQTGLIEHSKKIVAMVDARREKIEKSFRFGDLVIGAGVLPPVLVHTKNPATVENDVMRLAGSVYQIKQPARFFTGAPSWRDWLLMGLPSEADVPEIPRDEQLLPRDDDERKFWEQEVVAAYQSGYTQAQEIFDHNLSLLEEVYMGMRTFYDLYQRNMVSAPIIAKSQQIITQDDPNTIVVGDTLFRITIPAQFQTNHEEWKILAADHLSQPRLPVAAGFDPEQVRQAYAVYQEQQIKQQLEKSQSKKSTKTATKENESTKSVVPVVRPPIVQKPIVNSVPSSSSSIVRIRITPQGIESNSGIVQTFPVKQDTSQTSQTPQTVPTFSTNTQLFRQPSR